MALYSYASSSKAASSRTDTSEFDILKASHKFLREDEEQNQLPWNEQVAKKYYDNLYREFAVCDLKHYKSGNFSLRWRTESEVISGAGEATCGNTRCPLHTEAGIEGVTPSLQTLELPFSYVEGGENKFALVKVVLCVKCVKKLMWKRTKEKEAKEREQQQAQGQAGDMDRSVSHGTEQHVRKAQAHDSKTSGRARRDDRNERASKHSDRIGDSEDIRHSRRRRSSRSRSPNRDSERRPRRRHSRSR